ncbi:MAG: filamentous hemagglutinin N-terminal domain-containing protein [Xenococcaceae cyanobacterium MO_188.B29]|nr:filamentous hemagglutinin N-terminal domain-containing protein [Xenococcaceae cyanobacterium MO_188.B29]
MKTWYSLLISLLLSSSIVLPVKAQITLDGTTNTILTPIDNGIRIDDGNRAGNNLFHSFEQFSLFNGSEAFFNNANDIVNIFSRVTGGNISNIDGLLRANGTANLFLLNTAGIIFGENAQLNIGGSFVATTAESILFNNYEFSATNPDVPPLLTVNIPLGLQYGANPGEIINRSVAPDSEENTVGLQVKPSQTLALLGGNISLEPGNITVEGGRIQLGSVGANAQVSLNFDEGLIFEAEGVENFQDLTLSQGSRVDGDGKANSEIRVDGRRLLLEDGSIITTSNEGAEKGSNMILNLSESIELVGSGASDGDSVIDFVLEGRGDGGDLNIMTKKLIVRDGAFINANVNREASGNGGTININASELVELKGQTNDGFFASDIQGGTFSNSNLSQAGTININTQKLVLQDGGGISVSVARGAKGNGGNLNIKASESVQLSGIFREGTGAGGLFAQSNPDATGNAGTLTIDTKQLILSDGAQISTGTQSSGNGGVMLINASELVEVRGGVFRDDGSRVTSGIFSAVGRQGDLTDSTGKGGDITINTSKLIVDEAQVTASSFADGEGGKLTINVENLVIKNGGQVGVGTFDEGNGGIMLINASESIEIFGSGFGFSPPGDTYVPVNRSSLFARSQGAGDGGSFTVNTGDLIVRDGGEVTTSGLASGLAGDLLINGNSIFLDNGSISAMSISSAGGNIILEIDDTLTLRDNSTISARAFNNANGGNIEINSDLIVAFPNQNNDIIANAEEGNGGNIEITTRGIFGIEERPLNPFTNDINASSEFGLDGTININLLDTNPVEGIEDIPRFVIDPDKLVVFSLCSLARDSEFYYTAKGGNTPDPVEIRDEGVIAVDLVEPVPFGEEEGQRRRGAVLKDTASHKGQRSGGDREDREEIVEAQGWIFHENGVIELVAYKTDVNGSPPQPRDPRVCPK